MPTPGIPLCYYITWPWCESICNTAVFSVCKITGNYYILSSIMWSAVEQCAARCLKEREREREREISCYNASVMQKASGSVRVWIFRINTTTAVINQLTELRCLLCIGISIITWTLLIFVHMNHLIANHDSVHWRLYTNACICMQVWRSINHQTSHKTISCAGCKSSRYSSLNSVNI